MSSCDLLLTGAGGFVGGHVLARAKATGLDVRVSEGDLRDAAGVAGELSRVQPAAVIHLASSWHRPSATPWQALADDVAMAAALLEGLALHAPGAVLLTPGTAAQYGLADTHRLKETDGFTAVSPYGVAKSELERLLTSEPMRADIRVIWTRSFNHIGPGQGRNAPLPQWAARIAEAELRGGGPVPVGRLDVIRDVLDVRDVADAYLALVRSPAAAGVYNVCSGVGLRMSDLLDMAIAEATAPVVVEQDPTLMRAADPEMVVGDPARLRAATGWAPRVELQDSVRAVLDEWRVISASATPVPERGN